MKLTHNEFVRGTHAFAASRRHGRIVYVLQGDATLSTGDEDIALSSNAGALAIVNAGREATLNMSVESLAVVCTFDASGLRRMLNDRPLYFVCDPSLRHQAAYAELARNMDALLAADTETGDFARLHREVGEASLLIALSTALAAQRHRPCRMPNDSVNTWTAIMTSSSHSCRRRWHET